MTTLVKAKHLFLLLSYLTPHNAAVPIQSITGQLILVILHLKEIKASVFTQMISKTLMYLCAHVPKTVVAQSQSIGMF